MKGPIKSAWALLLIISATMFAGGAAVFAQNLQPPFRLYALPQGSDPGIPIATLFLGKAANQADNTRYAGDALCAGMRDHVIPVIVRVLARPGPLSAFQDVGTGFFVSAGGRVAMCEHELGDHGGGLRIVTLDNRMYTANVIKHDPKHDLCILQVRHPKGESFPAAALGSSQNLTRGQNLIAFGYPLGWRRLFMSPGEYRQSQPAGPTADCNGRVLTYMDVTRPMLGLRMHSEFGNSGSPVFDLNEHVVGMVQSIDTRNHDSTSATPVEDLLDALK